MEDPTYKWVVKSDKHDVEKLKTERGENGFSTYDWWNFDQYLAWVIWQACERFKTAHGHPAELTHDEWIEALNEIQAGMKAHQDIFDNTHFVVDEYDELLEIRSKGLAQFSKWMPALWD
jgi:hypothetical protein